MRIPRSVSIRRLAALASAGALAATTGQIKTTLDAAEFGGAAITQQTAKALASQAQSLIDAVVAAGS